MAKELIREPGTTYDDWLLLPDLVRKPSEGINVLDAVSLKAPITKYKSPEHKELRPEELPPDVFTVNTPFLSSPMQAITGPNMGIALAKEGGLGVIFCSQPVDSETAMIRRVKKDKSGRVIPDVFGPQTQIAKIAEYTKRTGYSTFPITDNGQPDGKLLGILTDKDYVMPDHASSTAEQRMISLNKLTYGNESEIGDNLKAANEILIESHHGAIPIVDNNGHLVYMVFRKDIQQHRQNPLELVDNDKRYKIGAAVNTHDYEERIPAVINAGADILVLDSSQGHSEFHKDVMDFLNKKYSGFPFIDGNIVTEEGFDFLVKNGAYAVKVGMGPGSICTTHETLGIGRAQATAVHVIDERRKQYLKETGIYIPIIADGGIRVNRNILIALALGADAVMAGRFFAGFHESAGPRGVEAIEDHGRRYESPAKLYWGEGSERAKAWREKRYGQAEVPEGIEGTVPYIGRMADSMPDILRTLKIGMQRGGFASVYELHTSAVLERESESTIREGKPHDIGSSRLWREYSPR